MFLHSLISVNGSSFRRKAAVGAWLFAAAFFSSTAWSACPSLLDHRFPVLQTGEPKSLCDYQGKVVLVVNTASYCGFTNQYDGLEKMYERLKGRGLVVLGFPSNDFGEQEPGKDGEIADFCRLTYGVKFPMVGKSEVSGKKANAFYKALAQATGQTPKWNFHKYLINRAGNKVESFSSMVKPDDPQLLARIEALLKEP